MPANETVQIYMYKIDIPMYTTMDESTIKRIMPGGMMRPIVEGLVGDDGPGKLRAIDAWLQKLESCDSHYLTSSEGCLSNAYSGASCDPEAAEEKDIEPLAKCEGFVDINGFKLIAHNVGHLTGTSALVKHGTEGNDYVNTFVRQPTLCHVSIAILFITRI